jgi:dihydrofolate reductase
MRKLIIFEWMCLDGVVQAPAYAGEDTSGGFKHGGWHLRYFEERSMKWVVENVNRAGGFLFGRRTYGVFAAHWPNASPEEQALAQPLNTLPRVRRVENAAGATRLAELEAARGRSRRVRGRVEKRGGQRSACDWQH